MNHKSTKSRTTLQASLLSTHFVTLIASFRVNFIAVHSTASLNVCQESSLPLLHHMKPLHCILPTTELHVHRSIPPFTHLCALTLGLNTSKHLTHCSPVIVGTFVPALRSRFGDQSITLSLQCSQQTSYLRAGKLGRWRVGPPLHTPTATG